MLIVFKTASFGQDTLIIDNKNVYTENDIIQHSVDSLSAANVVKKKSYRKVVRDTSIVERSMINVDKSKIDTVCFVDYKEVKQKTGKETLLLFINRGAPLSYFDWSASQKLSGDIKHVRDAKVVYLSLFLFLFLVVLSYKEESSIRAIVNAVFTKRGMALFFREISVIPWSFVLSGSIFSVFVMGYVTHVLLRDKLDFFINYWLVCAVLLSIAAIKIVLLRFIAYVYKFYQMVNAYMFISFIVVFFTSLIMFPLLVAQVLSVGYFSEIMIDVIMVVLAVSVIYFFVRSFFVILFNIEFSKLYFIVYLCTLEICPLFLLYKYISV